jgi:predicted dehydrogenase
MNELEFFDNTTPEQTHGFTLIQATEASHPYAGHYWPVAHIIGYEHTFTNLVADAITNMAEGKRIEPDFVDGYENQRVLDAVERSSETKQWVAL